MRRNIVSVLKISGASLLLVVTLVYTLVKTKDLLWGVPFRVSFPENASLFTDNHIHIVGTAKHVSALYLNGNKILTNPEGTFDEEVILTPGLNTFQIVAVDKFNREQTQQLQLVHRPQL